MNEFAFCYFQGLTLMRLLAADNTLQKSYIEL